MLAQGRHQNYISVPSHEIGYCEIKSVSVWFSCSTANLLFFCAPYWQHVIKSGKSNFRVVGKYMDRRYCSARHVGLFKLDSAVRKGRKLLDIYRLNDTPEVEK